MRKIVKTVLVGILLSSSLLAQPALRLKARQPSRSVASPMTRTLRPAQRHWLVQFPSGVSPAAIEGLRARGATMLQYVPDGALLISAGDDFDAKGLDLSAVIPSSGLEKLSPAVAGLGVREAFLVEFFPDVSPADARAIASVERLAIREHADLLPHHLLLEGGPDAARRIARWDEVAYVFPASEELRGGRRAYPCAGALTGAGPVGQYVASFGDGWDGPGLNAASLSFAFGALTNRLTADQIRSELVRAMQEWSRVVKIAFTEGGNAVSPQHIQILFASGSHGDAYPFDGPGKTLAHTFYPAPPNPEPLAGDMHLDADESWHTGSDIDLYSVVLHEMGHALGLGHSDQPSAVMYPYYRMQSTLADDDIAAIRQLYAAAENNAPAIPAPPAPAPAPPAPAPEPPPAPKPTPSPDRTPPSLTVSSPTSSNVLTTASTIAIKGTASDSSGVKQVMWTTSTGSAGIATGTTDWTIASVPLFKGTNYITIRAFDTAGNSSWRSLVVTRR